MYFDLDTYLKVLRRASAEPYHPRRRKLTWAFAILFPVLAIWDSVFFAMDHIFFPGFRRVEVRTPVFIVGSARSGTTNIHRLLAGDERFSYFRTWQILLPSILQKKIVGWIAAFDRRWLRGAIDARINDRQDRAFAKARRMHDWRLDGAEEDGFLGLHTCGSGTLSVIFPYSRMLEHLNDLDRAATPRQRRRILRFYEGCVKRQLYCDGGEKILLSKNPAFISRMRSLLEVFPDLKFIYTVRHPYETIPSLVNMLQKGWRAMGAAEEDIEDSVAWLRESGVEGYRYAVEVLDSLPEDAYAVSSFGDLVAQPRATIEEIYARFGWEITPAYSRFLEGQQERARAYESQHRYEPGLGPPRDVLHVELAELFERFGWEKEGEAPVA